MKEEWKDIKGYEGLYQISSFGRVKSLNYMHKSVSKYLSLAIMSSGYVYVLLYKEGKRKMYRVHRLVAEAFIPNPNNYKEVNHKDENKQNNRVDNLEWCTRNYNHNYGTLKERRSLKFKGENNPMYGIKGSKNPRARKVQCITTGKKFNCITDATDYYLLKSMGNIVSCCEGKLKSAGKHPVTGEKLVWKYLDDK